MRFRASFAAIAWIALAAAAPLPALGDEPNADDKRAAGQAFAGGEKAFAAGDYLRAAELFEEANRRAPHFADVWNAARAYQKLGEQARAATLYARYLRIAPADAPDRDGATAALRELAPKLGRIDVYAPTLKDLKIDGKALGDATIFVPAGSHLITGVAEGKTISRSVAVEAGASASVALPDAPAPPPPTTTTVAPPPPIAPPPRVDPAPPPPRGWSPAVVIVGGSLTAASLGLMIASGVDTNDARAAFDANKHATDADLNDGKAKEVRTNVLIGVTAGLGALTAAAAVFFVDWRGGSNRAKIGITPGGARVAGSF